MIGCPRAWRMPLTIMAARRASTSRAGPEQGVGGRRAETREAASMVSVKAAAIPLHRLAWPPGSRQGSAVHRRGHCPEEGPAAHVLPQPHSSPGGFPVQRLEPLAFPVAPPGPAHLQGWFSFWCVLERGKKKAVRIGLRIIQVDVCCLSPCRALRVCPCQTQRVLQTSDSQGSCGRRRGRPWPPGDLQAKLPLPWLHLSWILQEASPSSQGTIRSWLQPREHT